MRDLQHGHGAYGAESAAAHAPSVRSQGANTLERLTSVAHRIHSVRARTDDGGLPRLDRLSEDREGRARIQVRVDRLAHGNPGQHRNLAGGVAELKIDFGPGYRVYYTVQGEELNILLAGGDKSTQQQDIRTAITLAQNL